MSDDDDDDGAPLCCGEILARVAIDGHDALRLLTIDCGGDAPLKIATNAPNVDVGKKIVCLLYTSPSPRD